MTLVYVAGIGFRRPGVRLARETSVTRDRLTLTVQRFVSGPDGIHVTFDIVELGTGASCYVPTEGHNPFDPGNVTFRAGSDEQVATMTRSATAIVGGLRYVVQSFRPLTIETVLVEMQLENGYYGDWTLTIPVEAFGLGEGELVPRNGVSERSGITVRVTGMSTTPEATAVAFEVEAGPERNVDGVGGLHDRRYGPSRLALHDDLGNTYEEQVDLDISRPAGSGHIAVFAPLGIEARELMLEIPFVYVNQRTAGVDVALPIAGPAAVTLGQYQFRVRAAGPAPDSPRRRNFGPALAVELEMGDWLNDTRLLFPSCMLVDGQNLGMGYGNGINAADPKPVDTIEVRVTDPLAVKRLTFSGGTLQIRGPWNVPFPR